MKRAKRLYTLLGILAVVSVLTFCVLNYQEKQEEIKASGEVVLSIDPEEVTAFSWEYEALDPLSFHKDESWTYDEDSTFPVDEGQITSLLEQFRNFSAAFIIEDVTDYGQYGLDDPICTIHITAGAFVSVLAVLSSGWFVRMGGIQGGSFVYMLLMAALMVFFGIFSAGFMKQKERAQKHNEG